jgi:uncharacterized protein YggT (Ycf19 family)
MRILLWIVRIYIGVIILWAVSSWFGGLPAPLSQWLHWLTWPVWRLFGWAQLGMLNLAGVIALVILFALEEWFKKQVAGAQHGQPPPPATH